MARKRKRDSQGRFVKTTIFDLFPKKKGTSSEPSVIQPLSPILRIVYWIALVSFAFVGILCIIFGVWLGAIFPLLFAYFCYKRLQVKSPAIREQMPTLTTQPLVSRPVSYLNENGYTNAYSLENGWGYIICSIAGSQYHQADQVRNLLKKGTELELQRDTDNQHDPFAVRIYLQGKMLGFIPSDYSMYVSEALYEGDVITAELISDDPSASDYHRYKIQLTKES